jgi:DNA-binding NarL/FixJ family response regulator
VKVVLVDDSKAVQQSFGDLLAAVPGVSLEGCAEDVAGALALIDATRPDVVVLDLGLRDGERGIDVLKQLRRMNLHAQVVVLSNFIGTAIRRELLAAGALAFFDKSSEFLLARDWIAARAATEAASAPGDAASRRGSG